MADDDLARDAKLFQEAREAEPERLRAHQVDFLFEQPTRVIFAKTGWFHHRLRFKCVSIGGECGLRLGEQGDLGHGSAGRGARRQAGAGLRGPERPEQPAQRTGHPALEPECANC